MCHIFRLVDFRMFFCSHQSLVDHKRVAVEHGLFGPGSCQMKIYL